MSCSCCRELLKGADSREERGGDRLLEEEERSEMDVSVLREEYRRSRESQRRQTHLLLFRTVSEDLSEAITIVPVPQALGSSREPDGSSVAASPSDVTFEPEPMTCDPWHIHLGLHRRSHRGVTVQLPAVSPEVMDTRGCSPSRSCSSTDSKLLVDSPIKSPGTSGNASPCGAKEDKHFQGAVDRSSRHADCSSTERPRPDSICATSDQPEHEAVQGSVPRSLSVSSSSSKRSSGSSSSESSATAHLMDSAPVASITGSTGNLNSDLDQKPVLHSDGTPACHRSRKFQGPASRVTRQLSVGGIGSSASDFFPFPHRKSPRISEAAKRLGMYSSF
ncbi:uncharacterized protein LOC117518846 [Thalassophryne amazonica]|uniref:uncharacterized protein LOC117518846 n=1 Tax=Thalassophryne amazonica TaxID=390379 RepID=UPI001471EC48|nr:uncharacterized protein LOC117518846 [Thalassophryne amazonica]